VSSSKIDALLARLRAVLSKSGGKVTEDSVDALVEIALTGQNFGGYFAKNCTQYNVLQLMLDLGIVDPELVTEMPQAVLARMEAGNVYENVVGALFKEHCDAGGITSEFLTGDRTEVSKAAREQATLAAMRDRVQVIFNARFPKIAVLHGSYEPDVLLYAGDFKGRPAYYGGDVKDHKTTTGETMAAYPVSTSMAPMLDQALETTRKGLPQVSDDLQLAHYDRAIAELGFGVPEGEKRWGFVIGRGTTEDGQLELVWRRLDTTSGRRKQTPLESYDAKFAKNLAIVGRQLVKLVDSTVPAHPYDRGAEYKAACKDCPFYAKICKQDMAENDHITLIPGITPDRAVAHYEQGVTTRRALARLDWRTATVVDAGDSVYDLIDLAEGDQGSVSVASVLGTTKKAQAAIDTLASADITTVGAMGGLDATTLSYLDSPTKVYRLADSIDQARVVLAGKVHRARGVEELAGLKRRAIELDLDVEDDGEIVYMIGIRATGRRTRGGEAKARSEMKTFVDWTHTPAGEATVFADAWGYMQDMFAKARVDRHSIAVYYYSAKEKTEFRKLAIKHAGVPGVPTLDAVNDFFELENVVDMLPLVSTQLIWPTMDSSLKTLAGWCRFSWRDTDPSGSNSIAWYHLAVNAEEESERLAWRERVTLYNEDDVAAQTAIRDWLTQLGAAYAPGQALPAVGALDVVYRPRPFIHLSAA
jgi:hypothetical protein